MTERIMKDSGQEWLGNVPKEWNVERLQWHLYEINDKNNPIKTDDVLSLTNKKGVIPYEEKGAQGNISKDNHSEYKLAYPDTIVANSMNILIGSVGYCNYFGCVSPVYYVFKEKKNNDLRFFNYLFQTTQFQKLLRNYANGILEIRLRVSSDDILKRMVAVPEKDKQTRIADFLDSKCSEIDNLAKDIEHQIETLEEYKKSVITEAVTKGLNPDVEMKDSSIKGIDKYPTEWVLTRLKYVLSEPMKYGASESGVDYSEELPRYIRITDITLDNKLKNDDKLSLTKQQANGYILKDNTILFARSGATVGKTFLYKKEYGLSAFAGYLISACPETKIVNPKIIYYWTLSNAYWSWANRIFSQATIQNIGADKYSNMPVLIPSKDEQQHIIDYLDAKCFEIDSIILDKKKQLDTLAEYKKSLIYEYVTGKKEVTQ